jgi:hypothetical protein
MAGRREGGKCGGKWPTTGSIIRDHRDGERGRADHPAQRAGMARFAIDYTAGKHVAVR